MRKTIIWGFVILFVCATCLIALAYMEPAETEAETVSPLLELNVNGLPLYIDLSLDETWYDLQQMTSEFAMPISVKQLQGYQLYLNGKPAKKGETVMIKLEHLDKLSGVEIRLVREETEKHYYIRGLHQAAPTFQVNGKGENGFYYFTCSGFLFKMNSEGEVVYYRQDVGAKDFKTTVVDGKRYYSYLSVVDNVVHPTLTSTYATTKAIVMDDQYQVIDVIEFLSTEQGMPDMHSLESHEFTILGEHHYLITAYVGKLVDNMPESAGGSPFGTRVLASVFQELRDGRLLFQWDSSEHPELYALSQENNDYRNEVLSWSDYAHLNSVQLDPVDGNYICSFRHLDAVLKISRETGETIWILGGTGDQFGLQENQKMRRQHFARISADRHLIVFDNHTSGITTGYPNAAGDKLSGTEKQSRVMEYWIDEDTKTLTAVQEYTVDGMYSSIMGSAQRLEGNRNRFLIGWGGRDSGSPLFSEVDFDLKKILFEVISPHENYGDDCYRAYWFEY